MLDVPIFHLILITGLCAFQINMSFTCVVWQRESEIWRDLFRQDACKGTELFVYLNIYLCFVIPTPYTYFSWDKNKFTKTKTNQMYVKHINFYFVCSAICFETYRAIIRSSSWIKSLKHCVRYWDPTNIYKQWGWQHV